MAQFEIFPAGKQHFGFRLKKTTGELVLRSDAFPSITACRAGIQAVKAHAALDKHYQRIDPPASKHCFVLQGADGRPLARSDFFSSAHARENDLDYVKRIAAKAAVLDLT